MILPEILEQGLRPGIITASAKSLTADHLNAVGADPNTPFEGLDQDSHLSKVLLGNLASLDQKALRPFQWK